MGNGISKRGLKRFFDRLEISKFPRDSRERERERERECSRIYLRVLCSQMGAENVLEDWKETCYYSATLGMKFLWERSDGKWRGKIASRSNSNSRLLEFSLSLSLSLSLFLFLDSKSDTFGIKVEKERVRSSIPSLTIFQTV